MLDKSMRKKLIKQLVNNLSDDQLLNLLNNKLDKTPQTSKKSRSSKKPNIGLEFMLDEDKPKVENNTKSQEMAKVYPIKKITLEQLRDHEKNMQVKE